MYKYFWITIAVLICLAATQDLQAQRYREHYFLTDTSLRSQALSCTQILNYFTEGKPDSLFIALNKDTSIVKLDSLKKYSSLHQKEYNYRDDGHSSTAWTSSPTECFLERTYVGAGEAGELGDDPESVLVMKVALKLLNGKFVITKISFRQAPTSAEIARNILDAREDRAKARLNDDINEKGQ